MNFIVRAVRKPNIYIYIKQTNNFRFLCLPTYCTQETELFFLIPNTFPSFNSGSFACRNTKSRKGKCSLELLSEKVTKELCCFMRVRVLQLLVVNYTERLAEHSSWLAEAPEGESWLRPVRTRMETRPLKSLQRQSQNDTANICSYHLILYLGSSCFVASVFFLSDQNFPHGNFSLLKCKQLSGWAGGDKTRHLHDNIAVVIAYF